MIGIPDMGAANAPGRWFSNHKIGDGYDSRAFRLREGQPVVQFIQQNGPFSETAFG